MSNLSGKKLLIILILVWLAAGSCSPLFHKNHERQIFGKTHLNRKEAKIKEPRRVKGAKKKQEKNDRKRKKEYNKSVKQTQKRSLEIQTPEVKERMKQNKKNTVIRDRSKKKKDKANSKKAANKYK
jgi:hypothetical protein